MTEYDDSWRKKIKYGGPPIDWDAAWAYYAPARRQRRARRDLVFAALVKVRSPQWGSRAPDPSAKPL